MKVTKRTKPVIVVYIIAIVMAIIAIGFFIYLNQASSSITDEADTSDPVRSQRGD